VAGIWRRGAGSNRR